jgi:hypothetical protein
MGSRSGGNLRPINQRLNSHANRRNSLGKRAHYRDGKTIEKRASHESHGLDRVPPKRTRSKSVEVERAPTKRAEGPTMTGDSVAVNPLPDWATKKATNIATDARLAVVVGLIPLLGLAFILRLVQWYLVRKQFPTLVIGDSQLSRNFRGALHRLWFAVLFWPVVFLLFFIYVMVVAK